MMYRRTKLVTYEGFSHLFALCCILAAELEGLIDDQGLCAWREDTEMLLVNVSKMHQILCKISCFPDAQEAGILPP